MLRSPAGRVAVLNVLDSGGAEQSGGAGHQEDVSCCCCFFWQEVSKGGWDCWRGEGKGHGYQR